MRFFPIILKVDLLMAKRLYDRWVQWRLDRKRMSYHNRLNKLMTKAVQLEKKVSGTDNGRINK